MEILYAGAKLLSSPESRQETASPISHEKERERERYRVIQEHEIEGVHITDLWGPESEII